MGPLESLGRDDALWRHQPQILAYLRRLLGDPDDAQDACQETMLRAHRSRGRLRPGSNERAWLYRIATNCARSLAARRRRHVARLADVDLMALPARGLASVERREELRRVARTVRTLPPKQRAALLQRRFQGLDYDEIAAALGCSPAAARANVYQAIRKLREALER